LKRNSKRALPVVGTLWLAATLMAVAYMLLGSSYCPQMFSRRFSKSHLHLSYQCASTIDRGYTKDSACHRDTVTQITMMLYRQQKRCSSPHLSRRSLRPRSSNTLPNIHALLLFIRYLMASVSVDDRRCLKKERK
jgi:hypothetical protein